MHMNILMKLLVLRNVWCETLLPGSRGEGLSTTASRSGYDNSN